MHMHGASCRAPVGWARLQVLAGKGLLDSLLLLQTKQLHESELTLEADLSKLPPCRPPHGGCGAEQGAAVAGGAAGESCRGADARKQHAVVRLAALLCKLPCLCSSFLLEECIRAGPFRFALILQAEVEALKTAAAREKHSREAQQKKCTELEASLRRCGQGG